MLRDLEISGFKSFAKKAVLEFRSPISAIVGPNGSGKSNVAEALRFVLGEQSFKSMRGKKGEDLIFNGSAQSPRANRAAVKIIFDNSSKVFDLDFDSVSIERIVHRDGSNEYMINGSQVRLKDILELLSKANIGASGHQIISQGEADRILNVSAKERKTIIEDALGLKIYQYKKEESIRKLTKTEENVKQIEGLRREIAPHLRFLQKQVEKLEKLESMKEQLVSLYLTYFRREGLYLKLTKDRVEADKKQPTAELLELDRKLQEAKNILEADRSGGKMEEMERAQVNLEQQRREVSELERELGRFEGEIISAEKNLKRQRDFFERQEATNVSIVEVRNLKTKIEELSSGADTISETSALKNIISSIRQLIRGFIDKSIGKSDEENKVIEDINSEIKSLKERQRELEKRTREAKEKLRSAEDRFKEKTAEVEQEKDSYQTAEKEIYKIMARQNEVRGFLNSLRSIEDRLAMEGAEYERELAEAVVLAGRAALNFDNVAIRDEEGRELSTQEIISEQRRNQEERKKEIEKIKIRLEDQGIAGSDEVMKEFNETTERDQFLERELNDLLNSASSLKELILELESKLNEEFKIGTEKINKEFKRFFTMMFGGGDAGIFVIAQAKRKRRDMDLDIPEDNEMEEVEEETEEGLEVRVSLPHKKTKGLMMLSGGERALTSIALLFAITQVNPPPFIVLDETDAALDEANSRKYADMVKALSAHSQVILITHNRETMNAAGILYGVTMGSDGVSKLLSVNFEEATNYAK
jgi:chromosome segregation ATPase